MVISMTDRVKKIIQDRDILVPRMLFLNFKGLGLTYEELFLLIYLLNTDCVFNPKKISDDLGIELSDILSSIDSLSSKGFISVSIKKTQNVRCELINLDGLYDKLSYLVIDKEEEKTTSIYDIFEKEFGRTISPMEYEIIGAWIENGIDEETIVLALKEATYNGVSNLRYIDKILSEWVKKGIKTAEDVEKSRINFKKKKDIKPDSDILNYDWLNDE